MNVRPDIIFAEPKPAEDFKFGAETASVFDDMVNRSVPLYAEIQQMVTELAGSFATKGSRIYDIGCATGTTFEFLAEKLMPGIEMIGIDNSEDMLEKAREKLKEKSGHFRFINANIENLPQIKNASVVILLLTLQFVRPINREKLIKQICNGLQENGCLILVEKVTGSHTRFNRLFIDYYYDYKRRMGYSELEISQKREALENVLIPYHYEENKRLLLNSGFSHVEDFFRWYNFSGMVAVK